MIAALVTLSSLVASKSSKDWSKVNWDAIDDEWKGGDAEEELITEDEVS